MKRNPLFLVFCLLSCLAFAQKSKPNEVPLTAEKWEFKPDKVSFTQENGTSEMHIKPDAGKVLARNFNFKSGTIEFDVKPNSLSFYFRYQDAKETECFYLRMARAGHPLAEDGVQYAPYIDGVLMWDMYVQYQSNAAFSKDNWNHVKLVISDSQMRMYVNSPDKPTLEVDHLEGNPSQGTLGFEGDMVVRNLVVKSNETEDLPARPGMDPTANDPRYIRSWGVSEPQSIPEKVDFSYDLLPSPATKWRVLEAERRGLVNLIRAFGEKKTRSIVWLKVKIKSEKVQKKTMDFGFVDDVWVFLNGQMVYLDKNLQGRLMEKPPGGRCSVENAAIVLPLKEGENELLIGLANDARWGWGAIARLNNREGIEVSPDPTFDSRLVKLKEQQLDSYAGTYQLPNGDQVMVTKEGDVLRVAGKTFINALLYPKAEDHFFFREMDLDVTFVKNNAGAVSNFVIYNNGKEMMDIKRVQ
ncbi:hypothetical protein GCM10027275_38920 [Rhabdobacter roseus]|uniref:Peptidase S12 Pab87-related C-terminal domain-containing protein n=1 Tax=Rhabdobacter roseus TaxID=1655419 RepID=A0A840TQJ2_9BACT|nr:DUF3471 domain-containing protein [Rhabdobacter roseus]MBB5285594.1 hypothetical protein [Rhabdobacter roseus]